MDKWSELRETIRELHDNNADKPDVVGVTGFLLNLMNVKDRDCALLKEQEPDASKYQYKYDHTDCVWYRDSRSKCPVTCSQYRDGWNDAMDFVFKNGAGYSPYKRR